MLRVPTTAIDSKDKPSTADQIILDIANTPSLQNDEKGITAQDDSLWLSQLEATLAWNGGAGEKYLKLLQEEGKSFQSGYWQANSPQDFFKKVQNHLRVTNPTYAKAVKEHFTNATNKLRLQFSAENTHESQGSALRAFEAIAWEMALVDPAEISEVITEFLTVKPVNSLQQQIEFLSFRLRLPETFEQDVAIIRNGYSAPLRLQAAYHVTESYVRDNLYTKEVGEILLDQTIDEKIRLLIVDTFSSHATPEMFKYLKEVALNDVTPEIRASALSGLSKSNSEEAHSILYRSMFDVDQNVRRHVVRLLSAKRENSQIAHWLSAAYFHEPSNEVRYALIRGSLDIGNSETRRVLYFAMHNDQDAYVRAVATQLIIAIDNNKYADEVCSLMINGSEDFQVRILQGFPLDPGPKILSAVIQLAGKSDSIWVRQAALQVLASYDLTESYNAIASALNDPIEIVQDQAARALGDMGTARALEILVSALKTRSPQKNVAVIIALGYFGASAAPILPDLKLLLDHYAIDVRVAAERAISKIERELNK